MRSLGIEVRVGVFVLAALCVLVGFVLVLGDFSLAPGFRLFADFAYSGGLQTGSPVKVSGIRIGRVTDLAILDDSSSPPPAAAAMELGRSTRPVVRASLVLEQEARPLFTDGAKLFVGMQGVIGEAYVEVSPGEAGAPLIAEGACLRGVDAPRLHVMALQLASLLDTLGTLSASEEGLSALGAALTKLVGNVDTVLEERREALRSAIDDGATSAADLRQITASLKVALGDGQRLRTLIGDSSVTATALRRDVPDLLARANASLQAVEGLTARANQALDPEEIDQVVNDLRQTMAHLKQTAVDARRVMDTIRRGDGTVGGLVTDPQLYDDLKEMLRDLKRNPWKMFWRD